MKKIRLLFQPHLLRPAIYRAIFKFLLGLVLLLLWDRYINHGLLSLVRDGFFVLGLLFLTLAWFSGLALDGMTWKALFQRNSSPQKKVPRRRIGDMVDFVEEKVVRLSELEEDERQLVYLGSNLGAATAFLLPAVVVSLLQLIS